MKPNIAQYALFSAPALRPKAGPAAVVGGSASGELMDREDQP